MQLRGNYIRKYDTVSDFESEYYGADYYEPWVSATLEDDDVNYNKKPEEMCLTFEILTNGKLYWRLSAAAGVPKTIEYKKNNGNWTSITSTTAGTEINVSQGDILQFRGDNAAYSSSAYVNSFDPTTANTATTAQFNVKGNIMSLIDKDNFKNMKTLDEDNALRNMFIRTNVVDASGLALPATGLTENCYTVMFKGCAKLTYPPKLPAKVLANHCYESMFDSCKSLLQTPELPAKTLAEYCYYFMFNGCEKLTNAPELPATTLADFCYTSMFRGCAALTGVPELHATVMTESCYRGMFNGCSNLTTAPDLPATVLAPFCYLEMFRNCGKLTQIPSVLPATILEEGCYSGMFNKASSIVTAPELPAATLVQSCYTFMFADCFQLTHIKCLATDISATDCTKNWTDYAGNNASGEKVFVKHPNMSVGGTGGWTWNNSSNSGKGIPYNWTVQDAS